MSTLSDIREAQNIKTGEPSYDVEGAYLADSSKSAASTGFTKLTSQADQTVFGLGPFDSTNGDTFVGDPYDKGGFLKRPNGWER